MREACMRILRWFWNDGGLWWETMVDCGGNVLVGGGPKRSRVLFLVGAFF